MGKTLLFVLFAVAILAIATTPASAQMQVEARDVTAETGLEVFGLTHGTTVADFDDDGREDALLSRHYDSFPYLMLNRDGMFENVTADAFPTAPVYRDYHDCAAADVDRNGRLDIYCTHGGDGGIGAFANELWLQDHTGVFRERATETGVGDAFGRGRATIFIDANRDEWPDLYVANQYPRKDGRRGPNRLFVNAQGRHFLSTDLIGLNRRLGGRSAQAIDYDGDGWEDLLVCGTARLVLYRNQRGRGFRNVTRQVRIPRRPCFDAEFGRFNRGRRLDLFVLRRHRIVIMRQLANGRFARRASVKVRLPRGRALALGEVNGDGLSDAYVVRSGPRPKVPTDEYSEGGDARDVILLSGRRVPSVSRVPQIRHGMGQSVARIDYDGNGLDDFIVMNGLQNNRGPTALIAFFPATTD